MRILALSLFLLSLGAAELPIEAKAVLDKYDAAVGRAAAEASKSLARLQEVATKQGNLEVALLIKAKIEALKGQKVLTNADLSEWLQGSHSYTIGASHHGQIDVRKKEVVDKLPGIQGELIMENGNTFLAWANGTRWTLTADGDTVRILASDGTGTIK